MIHENLDIACALLVDVLPAFRPPGDSIVKLERNQLDEDSSYMTEEGRIS